MWRANPVSVLCLGVCAAVFAVAQTMDPEEVRFLAFDSTEFPQRWWALLTYGFVHVEWNHIIVNMLILVWVGVWVERLIGSARFIVLVVAAILAGGMTLLVRGTAGIGFSAAAAAILVYYHVAFPWERELPLRIPNIVLPVTLAAISVGAIVFGWFASVGHYPHLAGGAVGLVALGVFRRHHRPLDDDTPSPPTPQRPDDDQGTPAGLGSRAMEGIRTWWANSSYLTDVALGFASVTVVSSVMMVVGWDTPKTGTFAYTHLLTRFAIVAALVAVFHLDGAQRLVASWRHRRTDRRREQAVAALRRQLPTGPVGRWAAAFTSVTIVLCVAVLGSSLWWEPPAGVALYWALLAVAAVLAAAAAARTRRRTTDVPPSRRSTGTDPPGGRRPVRGS